MGAKRLPNNIPPNMSQYKKCKDCLEGLKLKLMHDDGTQQVSHYNVAVREFNAKLQKKIDLLRPDYYPKSSFIVVDSDLGTKVYKKNLQCDVDELCSRKESNELRTGKKAG